MKDQMNKFNCKQKKFYSRDREKRIVAKNINVMILFNKYKFEPFVLDKERIQVEHRTITCNRLDRVGKPVF